MADWNRKRGRYLTSISSSAVFPPDFLFSATPLDVFAEALSREDVRVARGAASTAESTRFLYVFASKHNLA